VKADVSFEELEKQAKEEQAMKEKMVQQGIMNPVEPSGYSSSSQSFFLSFLKNLVIDRIQFQIFSPPVSKCRLCDQQAEG
jgi:hypothetical protein